MNLMMLKINDTNKKLIFQFLQCAENQVYKCRLYLFTDWQTKSAILLKFVNANLNYVADTYILLFYNLSSFASKLTPISFRTNSSVQRVFLDENKSHQLLTFSQVLQKTPVFVVQKKFQKEYQKQPIKSIMTTKTLTMQYSCVY